MREALSFSGATDPYFLLLLIIVYRFDNFNIITDIIKQISYKKIFKGGKGYEKSCRGSTVSDTLDRFWRM